MAKKQLAKKVETKKIVQLELEPRGLPIAVRVLLALATVAIGLYALRLWINPIQSWDLWFHLKVGQWIFTHHRLPPGEIFSAAFQGREWIVNAWLSDVLFWTAFRLGSYSGVILFQCFLAVLVFLTVAIVCRHISGRYTLPLLTTFLALTASAHRFNPRPEIFTMVMMTATLAILFRYKFRMTDRIVWLVPLGALWPNLHMGFTAMVAILGCFLVGEVITTGYYSMLRRGKQYRGMETPEGVISGKRLARLALASAAALLATLVNPYGPRAWLFFQKLAGQFSDISEWHPLLNEMPHLDVATRAGLAALAAITLAALLVSHRPRDLSGFILAGVFAAATWKFNRQLAQFCLVAPFTIAVASRDLRFPLPVERFARKLSRPARVALGAAAMIALVALLALSKAQNKGAFGLGTDRYQCSENAIRFIEQSGLIGGKLCNNLEPGGWIAWKLWPRQRIWMDGRIDVYGSEAGDEYYKVITNADLPAKLKQMGFDYCYFRYPEGMESVTSPFPANLLAGNSDWPLVFFDDGAMIYARREPRNARTIQQYGYQFLNPLTAFELQQLDLATVSDRVYAEAERAVSQAPDSALANLASGIALQLVKKPKESLKRLQRAKALSTRWEAGVMAGVEDIMGRASRDQADWQGAVGHYREAARLSHESRGVPGREAWLRDNLGMALLEVNKVVEAEEQFKSALSLCDDIGLTHIGLGRVCMARKQYKRAIVDTEKSLEHGDTPDARIQLAKCQAAIGNSEEALKQLEIAMQFNPAMVRASLPSPEFGSLRRNPRFQALSAW